jgi:opacity protein-like surface antigen
VFLNRIASSEQRENFKPRFSIKLTGGLGYIGFGDINTHLESYDNYLSERTNYEGGKTKTLHYGSDLEGELRLDISSKFAISIGIGYISGKNKSIFEYHGPYPFPTWFEANHNYFFKPKIKTIPLKLGIYYTIPLISRIHLFLNGGLGYYFSKASLYKHHLGSNVGWAVIYTKEEKYDVSANSLGFHGGIGFEYNITNNLALVLEAQGRYVKKKNLKGSRLYSLTFGMYPDGEEEGTLYIGERNLRYYGENTPDLVISQSKPTGDEFQNMREAVLDLSGFSLRLGIRIKVF